MPQIRMLYPVVGEDGTDWLPGTAHEASPAFAQREVRLLRRAELVEGEALPAAPLTTGSGITNRMAAPESRDPAPTPPVRKGRK